MKQALLGLVLIAAVFLGDYTFDYPEWAQIPELWECGREANAGFRWCGL